MTSVGYFKPQDAPLKQNTLIYILAHPSREAAAKNWHAFQTDPGWHRVRLCRSNRLLTDEVIRCAIAAEHGDSL